MPPSSTSFDLERLISDCRAVPDDERRVQALREVLARAICPRSSVLRALGEPRRAEIQRLYHAPDLTILNVIWAPHMVLMPHEHRMPAIIGVYAGREDNIFWRRVADSRVEAASARSLSEGDVVTLGHDIIHSVTNPIARFSCAVHIYAGDFVAQQRSQWDPETLREQPFDGEQARAMFEEANRRYDI